MLFEPGYARLEFIVLAKQNKRRDKSYELITIYIGMAKNKVKRQDRDGGRLTMYAYM